MASIEPLYERLGGLEAFGLADEESDAVLSDLRSRRRHIVSAVEIDA